MTAELVYKRDQQFSMHGGPLGFEKVGVLFRGLNPVGRVVWLGCLYWPDADKTGVNVTRYRDDERFAKMVVEAWNKRNEIGSGGVSGGAN